MGLLFALVFAVVNIVFTAKYGVSTVAACGFELSVLIGTIGLAISFVVLICGGIYYLFKKQLVLKNSFSNVIKAFGVKPLLGDQRGKTRWTIFMK